MVEEALNTSISEHSGKLAEHIRKTKELSKDQKERIPAFVTSFDNAANFTEKLVQMEEQIEKREQVWGARFQQIGFIVVVSFQGC